MIGFEAKGAAAARFNACQHSKHIVYRYSNGHELLCCIPCGAADVVEGVTVGQESPTRVLAEATAAHGALGWPR